VKKLRRICNAATIKIPPLVYTRVSNEHDVITRLKVLLQKHGLSEQSRPDEVARAKRKLQKERDLEGDLALTNLPGVSACMRTEISVAVHCIGNRA
jgi:hypothetical protein